MERFLLCRTGWMRDYRGLNNDRLRGGSAQIRKSGFGHEIYNFQPSGKRVYGYVDYRGSLDLGRIDPAFAHADAVDRVTVIWAAPHHRGGVFVVGWYKNATVYSSIRDKPNSAKRINPEKPTTLCAWSIEAKANDAHLVPEDARWLRVPRRLSLRSYVRYLDGDSKPSREFRQALRQYIGGGWKKAQLKDGQGGKAKGYQFDIAKRLKIENAAMESVTNHYAALKFVVTEVATEKRGWDLEARRGSLLLRIEVKGCSGPEAVAELTPNEYSKSQVHQGTYRVCLVTNALTHPIVHAFQWHDELEKWTSDDGETLSFEKRTAARIWVT